MARNRHGRCFGWVCAGLVAASPAWGQAEMGAGGGEEPDPPGAVLRGPSVPSGKSLTLIERSAGGRFEPLDQRAEVAAIQRMRLDDRTRERAMALVDARRMAVAMLLVDEIDLLRAQSDDLRAGRRAEAIAKQREMWSRFDESMSATPLLEPLRAVLDAEEHAELTRLVEEYWEAWVGWQLRDRMGAGEDVRAEVRAQLAFASFQAEIREGYEVSLRRYQQAMEGIYDAVEPTDEQREAIRAVVIAHIKKTRLDASPTERREAMHAIYELLDDGRKQRFFDYLLRQVVRDE